MSLPETERWLEGHAYLRPIGELSARVDRALTEIAPRAVAPPEWERFVEDYTAGVPLLSSASAAVDLAPGAEAIAALVRKLDVGPLPDALAAEVHALAADLRPTERLDRVVGWLLGDESFVPAAPGLLRYLGWTALARALGPLVGAFGQWRDEERWLRRYCPTCGSAPAMAQLAGTEARLRLLSCGCCRTGWRYRRTQCPFCEADSQRSSAFTVEGEAGLRIDYCEACKGYLKTYAGTGNEQLLLADWSSLHLDLLAHDRGLNRFATSLYDVQSIVQV